MPAASSRTTSRATPPPTPTQRRPSTTRRRLPLVPIVVGLIAVLGVVAVVASRNADEGTAVDPVGQVAAETQPVRIEGTPLPKAGDGTDLAVGQKAPDLHGRSFDGTDVAITADGTPKLIFFLAHWCPHCQREVPEIVDWIAARGAPKGVALYSVSTNTTSARPNYPPSEWLAGENWPVPVLADDAASTAADAVGLNAFPFYVAVAGDGRVVARASGELSVAQIEAMVDKARAV